MITYIGTVSVSLVNSDFITLWLLTCPTSLPASPHHPPLYRPLPDTSLPASPRHGERRPSYKTLNFIPYIKVDKKVVSENSVGTPPFPRVGERVGDRGGRWERPGIGVTCVEGSGIGVTCVEGSGIGVAGDSTNSGSKKLLKAKNHNFIETLEAMRTYNWGILGTGNIARKFCNSLHLLDNAVIYAVGSRDKERADHFATEYKIQHSYGSYQELASDPAVDIIYIATNNNCHLENALMSLRGGKNVICEKPLSINQKEVRLILDEAESRGLFFMEALWPPFQPSYMKAKELIDSGIYGPVLHMRGKFAFDAGYDPLKRTYNLELGGGSLLDIGIYPVMDILRFMGVPDEVEAWSKIAPTGVDDTTSVVFRYNDGRIAGAYSSFSMPAGISTEINCQKGNIILSRGRDKEQRLIIDLPDSQADVMVFNPASMGYQHEAAEVMRCIDEGLKESPVVPHSFSIALIKTLDLIRSKAGIIYPGHD